MPIETSLSVGTKYENNQWHIRRNGKDEPYDRSPQPIKSCHHCNVNVQTPVRHIDRGIRELCSGKTYDVKKIVLMSPNEKHSTAIFYCAT